MKITPIRKEPPNYSSSLMSAWTIVDKLILETGVFSLVFQENNWVSSFDPEGRFPGTGRTPMEAICRAALSLKERKP